MKYTSSSDPLYTVSIDRITKEEQVEISRWALKNITGQLVSMTAGGNYVTVKCASKPEYELDYFGRPNSFAEQTMQSNIVLGFTHQQDLTAFLIVFESKLD